MIGWRIFITLAAVVNGYAFMIVIAAVFSEEANRKPYPADSILIIAGFILMNVIVSGWAFMAAKREDV